MKITNRHKMSYLPIAKLILKHSDIDILDEISKYELPDYVGKYPVFSVNDIGMVDMIMFWNAKSDIDVYKYTAKALLGITEEKIIGLPLIDFLRITILMSETAKMAADTFVNLKRESDNPKIKEIAESFSNSDFSIIDRFVKRTPVYTHEEAEKLSWRIYLECFKTDTMEYDINEAINEEVKNPKNKK